MLFIIRNYIKNRNSYRQGQDPANDTDDGNCDYNVVKKITLALSPKVQRKNATARNYMSEASNANIKGISLQG